MQNNQIETYKQTVFKKIDEIEPELIAIADQIHKHPETDFEETFASDILARTAEQAGFRLSKPVGDLDTAFTAECQGSQLKPVVAFLAEYDALPELGHACGHNLIGTAGLGAAIGLTSVMDLLPGTVQLIGTPAEEGGGGKILLAERGLFNNVDVAMMFHPSNRNQLWKYAMASHILDIEFFGKAAHAASTPEKGISALDATIQTFNSINALRQYVRSDVRIHGIIPNGGKAPNIIPDYSSSLFYVRSLDDEYCGEVVKKIKECAMGAALATGARLNFNEKKVYKTLKTNMPLTQSFCRNIESLGGSFDDNEPMDDIGSTDMGNVSHITPSIHPYLKIGDSSIIYHTREFADAACSNEGFHTMTLAAKALAATAIDFFMDQRFQQSVRDDFKQADP